MIVRVLVVAADSLARAGLATWLTNQPGILVTGQIASGIELNDAVSLYRPDVIVWDVGADATRVDLRDAGVPIIALLSDATNVTEVWSAGVRGILLRDASAETLAAGVVAAAEGLGVIDPVFTNVLFPTRESVPTQLVEELTPREIQVLRLMAEGQSNKTIARELGISEHTVKFHVNAILGKLNVASRTEAVVHATRLGLILL